MIITGLFLMLFGVWALCLPARLRRWWTTEAGAVLIIVGLLLILAVAIIGDTK